MAPQDARSLRAVGSTEAENAHRCVAKAHRVTQPAGAVAPCAERFPPCNASVSIVLTGPSSVVKNAVQRERTHVQETPNSIARVNAFFNGGNASSSESASPRGQRIIAVSVAKSCVRPWVKAMPA